jgi:type I restriction enzyme M protein
MASRATETEAETVVKRILPYLRRRGYDESKDFTFEAGAVYDDRYARGYIDILVTCGQPNPLFLIEAKRVSRSTSRSDERQALDYGAAKKVPFVVVTNGRDVRSFNTITGEAIRWDGSLVGRVPMRAEAAKAVAYLRRYPNAQDVPTGKDDTLPFRPGLPLRQLNRLFAKCHTWIRNIEKREDDAFADFSKILFLKLLEEKADEEEAGLPYSYRFWELATFDDARADQVKDAIESMVEAAREEYGDVLSDPLKLNNSATFLKIVRALAEVSFTDSEADVKGASFEYFVRATLKGKRLGQYFTPRPLVEFMVSMIGPERALNALTAGTTMRIVDPACGTGGFLVYMLRDIEAQIEDKLRKRTISAAARTALIKRAKAEVFFGADANEGVASAAKMNMVIAGDGHANIWAEDTLRRKARVWDVPDTIDLVITNPPFGTSEADSLPTADLADYEIPTTKGQLLFLQRMLKEVDEEGLICTVIDEGALNTETAHPVRKMVLEHSYLRAVVRLPPETFRPNKINVRSAVLLLERRGTADVDLVARYPVRFIDVKSLGYDGTGTPLRGFDFGRLKKEVEKWMTVAEPRRKSGYQWEAFVLSSHLLAKDPTHRFDLKYWDPGVRKRIRDLKRMRGQSIRDLNLVKTSRGSSPSADVYVDAKDGFARVLKAGSSITSFGEVSPVTVDSDFIEKDEFDKLPDSCKVKRGDILLSSTGTGTLGKAAVWESSEPAVADGHVTIIRVDRSAVVPRYLADYLRAGFGHEQIERLYTGSTGLIELTAEQVNELLVDLRSVADQRERSNALRKREKKYRHARDAADEGLAAARLTFNA